ncbi:MAG: hypothetical protein AVDCRST_MAG85-3467, partial [uncultured Solirubrobacteraceae bacterium]
TTLFRSVVRGAIHAIAPGDFALLGRALVSDDDKELGAQLGQQVRRLASEHAIAPTEALEEVTAATLDALAEKGSLDKNGLHDALRQRVGEDLMPWCKGCKSHHVAPMLWRYATIRAGARLDADRRYVRADPGPSPAASDAVYRFLRFYGPATPADFAEWGGIGKPHAKRLWSEVESDLAELQVEKKVAWVAREDTAALESPPEAEGIRLLPPGDPYLQKVNRPLLTPDAELRKRLFRPVASPGAVLRDGRLAGLWRVRDNRGRTEITVEPLDGLTRAEIDDEANRVAQLRDAEQATVLLA